MRLLLLLLLLLLRDLHNLSAKVPHGPHRQALPGDRRSRHGPAQRQALVRVARAARLRRRSRCCHLLCHHLCHLGCQERRGRATAGATSKVVVASAAAAAAAATECCAASGSPPGGGCSEQQRCRRRWRWWHDGAGHGTAAGENFLGQLPEVCAYVRACVYAGCCTHPCFVCVQCTV